MSTYRIITSGGQKAEIQAISAGAAVEEGRWAYRNQTIKEIYSGLKQEDVDFLIRVAATSRPSVGFIIHDIPPHQPIPFGEERYKPTRAREDLTQPMFDEEAIRRESAAAKNKHDNP
jgi:hypothetical protein